jgi:AraC family transcriptional regulator
MPDLLQIARALDFVEENLQAPIGVADMAAAAGYSLYYFCRSFHQATHHTAYDYLVRRRLAQAARDLIHTDRAILDIALDYQFNSPETFARAFRRVFDTPPSQWRKEGHLDRWRLMPRLTLAHLEHLARGSHLWPIVEDRPALRVAGLMTLVEAGADRPGVLWDLLARCLEPVEPVERYGIAHYPEGGMQQGWLYLAGVVLAARAMADTALVVQDLPAQRYACFVHKGSIQNLGLTLDYVFGTWLPQSGETWSRPLVVERYGQDPRHAAAEDSEIEVYLPLQDREP